MNQKKALGLISLNGCFCILFSVLLGVTQGFPQAAFGDGMGLPEAPPLPKATPNERSDATFDPRLPPVLPGEEVNDDGNKMRVWSSAGGVPVSPAPEPFKKTTGTLDLSNGATVIMDNRHSDSDGTSAPR